METSIQSHTLLNPQSQRETQSYPGTSGFERLVEAFLSQNEESECHSDSSKTVLSYNEYALNKLLFDPQRKLILCLAALPSASCTTVELKVLLRALKSQPRMMDLTLRTVISAEVENSTSATALFRSNSCGVKLLSAYVFSAGQSYLVSRLKQPIERVLKVTRALEVDPSRMQNAAISKALDILESDGGAEAFEDLLNSMGVKEVEKNRIDLLKLVDENFLAVIFESEAYMPFEVRRVFTLLRECVRLKFPESASVALTGFLFLRFICPAIVAPQDIIFGHFSNESDKQNLDFPGNSFENDDRSSGHIKVYPNTLLSPIQRRNLVLIAKILQKIAGDSDIFKEKYMGFLNSCIMKRRLDAVSFCEKMCFQSQSESAWAEEASPVSKTSKIEKLGVLVGFLSRNSDALLLQSVNLINMNAKSGGAPLALKTNSKTRGSCHSKSHPQLHSLSRPSFCFLQ
jgi:hypothetical protein